jgi:SOS-response transcriptional repressor LexA
LADRLGQKISQGELARRCGWIQSRLGNYESGSRDPGPEELQVIARVTGVSPIWLQHGTDAAGGPSELLSAESAVRKIPVIDLVQAGLPREIADPYPPGAGSSHYLVSAADKIGPNAFALIVAGESMAPLFRPGDRVVVDPAAQVKPGNIVVARINNDTEATIKRFRDRGRDSSGAPIYELVPENPNFATLTISAQAPGQIIGPVVRHERRTVD